jgi:UDP-glucuronate decarboxylase
MAVFKQRWSLMGEYKNSINAAQFSSAVIQSLQAVDQRIIITGAGGWLGMATLELLNNALGERFAHRVYAFGSSARDIHLRGGTTLRQRPLNELNALNQAPSLLLHFAFLTKDRVASLDEEAYREANRTLSETVHDALDKLGVDAVFVASSGAAYSAGDASANAALQLYGTLKREDEDRFAAWAECRGRTAVIGRIFNVAGPYINKHQHYALAAFILDAIAERPVRVNAPHRVVRGFVAIRELMSLVFAALLNPQGRVLRFDTGGVAMELAEVAEIVAKTLGAAGSVRAALTSDRIDHYAGDPDVYESLLAQYVITKVPFDMQIRETADFLIAA